VLVLQVIVFLWCSFRTEICADIGQGKCCVIDWKSQGKSGNFVLEDLYEPCNWLRPWPCYRTGVSYNCYVLTTGVIYVPSRFSLLHFLDWVPCCHFCHNFTKFGQWFRFLLISCNIYQPKCTKFNFGWLGF